MEQVAAYPNGRLGFGREAVLVAAMVGAVAAILLGLGAGELTRQQSEASRMVAHTLEVLERASVLDAHLAQTASEGRGFLVDKNADSIRRFEADAGQVSADITALRALTADSGLQRSALDDLGPLIAARIGFQRELIARVQAGDEAGAMRLVQTQHGRALADQIEGVVEGIKAEERRLLAQRSRAAQRATGWTFAGLAACAAAVVASAFLAGIVLLGRRRERRHLGELRRLNAGLEIEVQARTAALAASEARTRASEAELRGIVESSADCIKLLDLDGRLLSINGPGLAAKEIAAFDALRHRHWAVLWPEVAHAGMERALGAARAGGIGRFSAFAPTAKGTPKWWDVIVSPVLDGAGWPMRLVCISRDITEARAAEDARRESDVGFRLMAEHATDMVSRVGPDGTRLYVSPASARVFGVSPETLIARGVLELIHADDRAAVAAMQSRLLAGAVERETASFRVLNPVRGEVWVEASAGSLRDPRTGASDGYVSVLRDVTERRRIEEQLRQAQRTEAIGQLTVGIAHDFNNMLQAILGSLGMLLDRPGLDADGRECATVAEQAARRGAKLTHHLLAFSRQQSLDPVVLAPGEAVETITALLARTLGSHVRVSSHVEATTWTVRADDAQLESCLFNLALNARDAMPDGGALRLTAGNAGPDAAHATGLPPGEYVRFAVQDEGTGMTPETLARALEPFFTTKPVGTGTGLGLAMVQGFARQSGGDVRIESAPGRGTTVSLWLPRATVAEAPAAPAPADVAPVARGRGRVLLVDDEATVSRTLSLFLGTAGYTALAVDSGEAALDLLRAGEPFDLLVTDQSMPGMTGAELVMAAARLRPGLPALLVTGYDRVSGLDQVEGHVTVLRKPVERAAFLRQVEALLGPAEAPAPS
jgi:PAS domain S-box-containing protein